MQSNKEKVFNEFKRELYKHKGENILTDFCYYKEQMTQTYNNRCTITEKPEMNCVQQNKYYSDFDADYYFGWFYKMLKKDYCTIEYRGKTKLMQQEYKVWKIKDNKNYIEYSIQWCKDARRDELIFMYFMWTFLKPQEKKTKYYYL